MIGEPCMSYINEVVANEQKKTGERCIFYSYPPQYYGRLRLGCDLHPSISGMVKMTNVIVPVIKTYMNW